MADDVVVQPVIEVGKGEPVVTGAGGAGGAGGKADAGKVDGGKAAGGDPEPKKRPRDDDDDPEPDDKGFISLPQKAFAKKIANMANRELKKLFGTDDVDKILSERKEHQELKKEKEERDKKADEERRAQLKKEELLAEDNAKLKKETEELRAAIDRGTEERLVDKQETYLQRVAGKTIDEDSVDLALLKFKKHVQGMSNKAVEDMSEKDVTDWFQEWTDKHPKHAKAASGAKVEPKKVPLDTATKKPGTKPVVRSGSEGLKRPMDMTAQEWATEKRRRGLSY